MIEAAVCQRVREGARLHELLADAEGALRQQQVVLPGLTVLDRPNRYFDKPTAR